MRRLLGRPTFVAAMVTIGLAIILKAAIVVIWQSRSVGIPIGRQPCSISPAADASPGST